MVEIKLRTNAEFKAAIQEMARIEKRSVNKFIEKVLEDYVDNFECDHRVNQQRVRVNLEDLK